LGETTNLRFLQLKYNIKYTQERLLRLSRMAPKNKIKTIIKNTCTQKLLRTGVLVSWAYKD